MPKYNPPPETALPMGDLGSHLRPEVHILNGISIGSATFAGLTVVTNRHTKRHTERQTNVFEMTYFVLSGT